MPDKIARFLKIWSDAYTVYKKYFLSLYLIAVLFGLPVLFLRQPVLAGNADAVARNPEILVKVYIWMIIVLCITAMTGAISMAFLHHKQTEPETRVFQYLMQISPAFIYRIILLTLVQVIMVMIGFMAFVLPGVYFSLALSMALQVLIVEQTSIVDAIRRSIFLTRGFKLEILLIALLLFLFSLGVQDVVGYALAALVHLPGDIAVLNYIKLVVSYLVQSLISPFGYSIFLVLYFTARQEKYPVQLEKN